MASYGYTFNSGDGVTPTRLNAARTVSAIQTADISDAQITAAKLASNAVETAKIADSAVTSAKIADGTIVNADINASAAIAGTKIAPDFGSQNVATTGQISAGGNFVTQITGFGGLSMTCNATTGANEVVAMRSRGTTASPTVVQSGDNLITIAGQGYDGSTYRNAAFITCSVGGAPGDSDMPGLITFSTTADGASTPTERMRISADGNIIVGTTSAINVNSGSSDGVILERVGAIVASKDQNPAAFFRRRTNNGDVVQFHRDTTQVGSISVTTTATAYNTSSDHRLKENPQPMTGALARLADVKPVTFTWKSNGEQGEGFIAHELQAVVPEAVTGEKDAVNAGGQPQYQGVDASKLVPILVAAVQELSAKVAALEAAQ
jgi:hypothetical protein